MPEEEYTFCPHCETDLEELLDDLEPEDEFLFCIKCGHKVYFDELIC